MGQSPYSKEEIYKMQTSSDEIMVFLMKQMLDDLPVEEAQEVISIPTQIALTFPFYATRRYFLSSKFLLENFPNLKFNFCCFFANSPGLIFKPIVKQLLERGLNPFIKPKNGKIDKRFVNWFLMEFTFDAHEELKNCVIQKEIYFQTDSYTQYKEFIKELNIHDELVAKYVTGFAQERV